MNKKIIDIMGSLGIKAYYHKALDPEDKYVIFNIYNEEDANVFDNSSLNTIYYITLNFWCKNIEDLDLYKDIKRKMKENKFIFDGCTDVFDENYYGKNMDFIFKEMNSNEEFFFL